MNGARHQNALGRPACLSLIGGMSGFGTRINVLPRDRAVPNLMIAAALRDEVAARGGQYALEFAKEARHR